MKGEKQKVKQVANDRISSQTCPQSIFLLFTFKSSDGGQDLFPVKVAYEKNYRGNAHEDKESGILLVSDAAAADGEENCAEESSRRGDDEKRPQGHVAQSHYIAEGVFWKTGDEKQDK